MKDRYSILIYGAGVIGSIYAIKLSEAGFDVTVYARSTRLADLRANGLLYNDKGAIRKASIKVSERLSANEIYDYIIVAVRHEQVETALAELAGNGSVNIVTMANNPDGYSKWESIVGANRLLPAFPGAGGRIENGVLHYQLTPKIVQPTTFGEINGEKTTRLKELAVIFKASRIPYSISDNMDAWQKSHIALVVSLASGFYFDGGDNYSTAKNKEAVHMSSSLARKNFNSLKRIGIPITPRKLNIFRVCPLWLMDYLLSLIFNTRFAETVMASHAIIAKDEMHKLRKKLDELIRQE